jgi:hypothetical protein
MKEYELQMEKVFALGRTMQRYAEPERQDIRDILKYNMKVLLSLRDELNKKESSEKALKLKNGGHNP